MIPAVPGRHLGASRPTIQSASAAMAGPAKQNSSAKPTRSAGPASWAMKNSGLPRRTSKSGCATARHQRLAMCSAARRPDTVIVLGVRGPWPASTPAPAGRRGRCNWELSARTRASPISLCRKRPFASEQRPRPAAAAVCRIPCLILCLAYVECVCQNAPCGLRFDRQHGADRRAADGDRVAVREGGPTGGRLPFGPGGGRRDEGRPVDLHASGVRRCSGSAACGTGRGSASTRGVTRRSHARRGVAAGRVCHPEGRNGAKDGAAVDTPGS